MKAHHIPNIISMLRILLVVPVVMYLLQERFVAALVLITVAGASDGLDGFLAKRYGWITWLGSILDPIADKLLLISCFVTLGWLDLLPMWLVIAVLARDAAILAGALAYHFLYGQYEMAPTTVSKLNTLMQIVLVLVVVFSLGVMAVPDWSLEALVYIVLTTTVISGVDYVWTWSQKAVQAHRKGSS